MTALLPYLLLLGLVAAAFVLVPLWRYRDTAAQSVLEQRREKNREVFRQREGELGNDLQHGLITGDEHARLLTELQRAFMLDMQALDRQQTQGVWSGGKPVLLVLALLVPLTGLLVYRIWGSAPDLALPELMTRLGTVQTEEEQGAVLDELAAVLQQRLERRPDDVQNGYTLGLLYLQLEKFPEAIATFQALLEHIEAGQDRATVLGQLAQAQYLQADSQLTPEAQTTVDEALSLNPNEYAVMGLLAIDALLKEDFVGALGYWRRQLSSATPGTQEAETVRQRIALIEEYLPDSAIPAVDTTQQITVVIDIAPELAAQVTDGMKLYVFARRPAGGPPLVAQNLDAPVEFPFTVTLDNTDAMMPGTTLESAPELLVGARLTRSGNPIAQSGDFQTLSDSFKLAEQTAPLELVIDAIVP
jgi:cytochrome c-type biogenesis protein CcmH